MYGRGRLLAHERAGSDAPRCGRALSLVVGRPNQISFESSPGPALWCPFEEEELDGGATRAEDELSELRVIQVVDADAPDRRHNVAHTDIARGLRAHG